MQTDKANRQAMQPAGRQTDTQTGRQTGKPASSGRRITRRSDVQNKCSTIFNPKFSTLVEGIHFCLKSKSTSACKNPPGGRSVPSFSRSSLPPAPPSLPPYPFNPLPLLRPPCSLLHPLPHPHIYIYIYMHVYSRNMSTRT